MYRVNGPVNMVCLSEIFNFVKTPSMYFPPYQASIASDAQNDVCLFDALKKRDILLHHPFQSFQTVVDFVRAAAEDPDVVVIKQTIYRAGVTSALIEALMDAANKGKEVVVIVEVDSPFRRGTEYRLGTAARTGWCTGGLWRNGTENTRQAGTGHPPRKRRIPE